MPQAKERAFRGAADVVLMRGLIQSSWRARGPINTFHVGDLHWRLREESTRDPLRDIRLWEDGTGRVIGFAWYDPPDAGDVLTHPDVADRSGLEARMLAWLEQRHLATPAPRAQRFITGGFDADPERLALLESLGYSRTTLGYPHFELGLDEPPAEPALPPGHRVKTAAKKLYESCGFRVVGIDRDWDRPLEPAP